ncbi:hypothetical protein BH708_02525 [Brachybacterium sp. P6-10-X1]|uniref:DUF1177 domain-containing protein n=1 Tax=Brachybacterium sp. P6-10-X1 TaxID=1903186 RepID=UPI0009717A99|nr:DUF1177 domain-containing protein [Brachybacterium sp. P6-10-X1]APX31777.1 hypothetical protein BH708_02525 [Brachybacterium sp. P6-10-X1]
MLRHVLEVLDVLDSPIADGPHVVTLLESILGADALSESAERPAVETRRVAGDRGRTDFVTVTVPGRNGRIAGGVAPTLGIIGRLGGIGARPDVVGFVSDGDGAAAALSAAAYLLRMWRHGDRLDGDVIISTHVCPDAPTLPHHPVPFMDSPVDIATMNRHEVRPEMDAVISIDTTKGNRLINHRGIALSPPVRQGYILPIPDDLLRIQEVVTGAAAVTFPLTTQDITPYGNGLRHINSILQPATATDAPVVGLAITSAALVPGSASGASHESDIALAARFAVEVAKEFGNGSASLHDAEEFERVVALYGSHAHLQTPGLTHQTTVRDTLEVH